MPGRSKLLLLLWLASCGEVGVVVEIAAGDGVPPLDAVSVQVRQDPVLVMKTFPLGGLALPQTVGVPTKGMTKGTVTLFVDGLSGNDVVASGQASAELEPASLMPRVIVVLEPRPGPDAGMPKADAGTADAGCTPQLSTTQLCVSAEVQCGTVRADDGCGLRAVDCGGCPSGESCRNGACCGLAHTQAQMCSTNNFGCGQVQLLDACGRMRRVDCGACSGGLWCRMSDTGSSCGACVPEDDAAFCARLGATCGSIVAPDNCGALRMVACGGCDVGVTCGATVANQCECLPLNSGCSDGAQCCNAHCGDAGFCCQRLGARCRDDSDCCDGSCALGLCAPYANGGILGDGLSDDGGTL